MKNYPEFAAVHTLRENIKDNQIQVIHPGQVWFARFEWYPPISQSEIQKCEKKLGIPLPDDFAYFLLNISDGAILYHEVLHGQWGYKIYGVDNLFEKQEEWAYLLEGVWETSLLAIGETYGDRNPIVIDPNPSTSGINNYLVKEGNEFDKPTEWPVISKSFEGWLENLITAQGAKYWLWFLA